MKILLAGEGGQGVQFAAEVLSYAAFLEGKSASLIPNFGVEQRGGVSLAFVKIGEGEYPKFDKADILAIFCDRALPRIENYLREKTKVIVAPGVKIKLARGRCNRIHDRNLPAKVWNILILGEIVKETQLVKKGSLKQALMEKLEEKFERDPELKKINLEALA